MVRYIPNAPPDAREDRTVNGGGFQTAWRRRWVAFPVAIEKESDRSLWVVYLMLARPVALSL